MNLFSSQDKCVFAWPYIALAAFFALGIVVKRRRRLIFLAALPFAAISSYMVMSSEMPPPVAGGSADGDVIYIFYLVANFIIAAVCFLVATVVTFMVSGLFRSTKG